VSHACCMLHVACCVSHVLRTSHVACMLRAASCMLCVECVVRRPDPTKGNIRYFIGPHATGRAARERRRPTRCSQQPPVATSDTLQQPHVATSHTLQQPHVATSHPLQQPRGCADRPEPDARVGQPHGALRQRHVHPGTNGPIVLWVLTSTPPGTNGPIVGLPGTRPRRGRT
jgi:hypothetical protein